MTKCGKCEGGFFTLKSIEPSGSGYKLNAVQCASCNTPFAVTDYYNVGQLLKNQEKTIADLGSKLAQMSHTVNQIAQAMNQMARR